jgi:hypothetical protein
VLDPGVPHRIVVTAPGVPDFEMVRAFRGTNVWLSLVKPATPLPPRRVGAIAAFAVGGVGLVVASLFGGLALRNKKSLDAACASTCPDSSRSTIAAAGLFANVSTIGSVVTGLGAALGTTLWITGAPAKPQTSVSVGPAGVGLRLSF